MLKKLTLLLLLLLTVPLYAQDADPTEAAVIEGTASVSEAVPAFESSAAGETATFTIQASGELADPCTSIDRIEQTVDDAVITITIHTVRPADLMCAQVVEPFEITIEVDTSGLEPGDYTVRIGDVELPLTVPDEGLLFTADDCPAADEEAGLALYEGATLCFLYPDDYSVADNQNLVLLYHDEDDVSLLVSVEASDEQTLDALQVELELAYAEYEWDWEQTEFGGLPALQTETHWDEVRVYVPWQEQLITFTLLPAEQEHPLWVAVMESVLFIVDESSAGDDEGASE